MKKKASCLFPYYPTCACHHIALSVLFYPPFFAYAASKRRLKQKFSLNLGFEKLLQDSFFKLHNLIWALIEPNFFLYSFPSLPECVKNFFNVMTNLFF